MPKYHKILSKIEPKELKRIIGFGTTQHQVYLVTFGLFDTQSANWKYYLTSCIEKNGEVYLTDDVCKFNSSTSTIATITTIPMYGREIKTPEEGLKWSEEFKMKWESGSNDLLSEVRDKKLDEILK